ncbi:MAG: ABC transporter substrate-binding protein [Gammaproteobacteria bacterium]|nr:ABC transporter substrate-binding protein [Gammaproteobacteria bacterium]
MHLFRSLLTGMLIGLATMSFAAAAEHGRTAGQDATAEDKAYSTTPRTVGARPKRIAFYQGGPHKNYYQYLRAVIVGLMELGWIEKATIPKYEDSDTEALWQWLVTHGERSKHLRFLADGFYSADWNAETRIRMRQQVIDRLHDVGDVDLIIAMGTWAGKDLANDEHSTPTIVMSTSDPVRSGIIRSVEYSGFQHVHARVDPNRYERQVRLFHDIIGFKKLGVAFEDTPDGRAYAAMDMVEAVAKEKGFEVVSCHTRSDIADQSLAAASVRKCFRELVKEVDAIYVTLQGGVSPLTMPDLVTIANSHRIPTFSQSGSEEVRNGFLLSISRSSFAPVGMFLAATVAKVLNGAKPGALSQLFEEKPNIAINLKTAELIGLYLYADVLAAADELYHEIGGPGL